MLCYIPLLSICFVAAVIDAAAIIEKVNNEASTDACDSQIYCQGELLKTIQLAELYNDSKTFVDLSQLQDPDVTLSNFNKLMERTNNNPTRSQLLDFISENFSAEDLLENWSPPDWQEEPVLLKRIQDPKFRQWAEELNAIWKTLSKKIKTSVTEHPSRHSLIYVENGFMIPGGRFSEFYYWDSYWVIEGLLLCGMNETVKGMIENFLSIVTTYGFVPNGGRVYYLMRSQPPLLIPMVEKYLEFTNDQEFLKKNIGILEKEFAFWQRQRTVDVEKDGKTYKMARYITYSEGPRPESYREDYELGKRIKDQTKVTDFYENIKAAAESGWDFSARWFIADDGSTGNLTDVSTRDIIPVDLNAFLQRNARLLSQFMGKLGNAAKAKYYSAIAQEYQNGIDNVLWNKKEGVWLDYDIKNGKARRSFYSSNVTPLYTRSYNVRKSRKYAESVVNYLKAQGIMDYMGGTPATIDQTGEQWDFPNAWPPLQSIIVGGLRGTGWEPATSFAKELATRWLRANYAGYVEYGEMFEKYDAVNPGQFGGGGEYIVQAGFGWTNGVILELLNMYSSISSSDSEFVACRSRNCIHR